MLKIIEHKIPGYARVIEGVEPEVGLHCFIAVHDCTLGPALGGIRFYPYKSKEDALSDALRLAKAMTYKSAIAEDGLGGGKSVIIGDPAVKKTDALLHAFGEVIDSLKGQYIAAEDIGTNDQDMMKIRQRTPYVAAMPLEKSSGDPSRFTAWGVFRGLQAVAAKLWGTFCLQGKEIAIQGVGSVGSKLANILFWEGVNLTLADVHTKKAQDLAKLYGAKVVSSSEILAVKCDIFAPCALGGILNDDTIPRLHCKAIAGAANNQLLEPRHGLELMRKGILYAPDYVINSGGIINAALEFEPDGYDPKEARDRVNKIRETLTQIFNASEKEKKPTSQVADEQAEKKLKALIGKRQQPIFKQI